MFSLYRLNSALVKKNPINFALIAIFLIFLAIPQNLVYVSKALCVCLVESFWIHVLVNMRFDNSEDPDEMPHNAAFHQDLHCLQIEKNKSTCQKCIII